MTFHVRRGSHFPSRTGQVASYWSRLAYPRPLVKRRHDICMQPVQRVNRNIRADIRRSAFVDNFWVISGHERLQVSNIATFLHDFILSTFLGNHYAKETPWPESASELYRPSDCRLLAKLVTTLADRGCHVVSVTDSHGRILGSLDRGRYYLFQVAPQLYSRG
jgi:CBS-domain-containing membrane protein